MKVPLSGGMAQVGCRYEERAIHSGVRKITTLSVSLPNKVELTAEAVCRPGEIFTRNGGRRYALIKLLQLDNAQAERRAVNEFEKLQSTRKNVTAEKGSLREAAKKFYQISREDRQKLFRAVCPKLFPMTQEQIATREKMVYERLCKKFAETKK